MNKYKSETEEFIEFLKKDCKAVTKEKARKILYDAGLITKDGKNKKLIKDTHL